jgi:2'-5' RNA ligase
MPRAASTQDGEERWRCFVAVPISDELRALLADYVAEMRQLPRADSWRWTHPDGWHITLAFLGSISPASVPDIATKLAQVTARHTPFTTETRGLDAFPSLGRPRVLYLAVYDTVGMLAELARDVQKALDVEQSGPFRGHIPLARRPWRAPRDVVLPNVDCAPAESLRVGEVSLVRTHLRVPSPRYESLRAFAL